MANEICRKDKLKRWWENKVMMNRDKFTLLFVLFSDMLKLSFGKGNGTKIDENSWDFMIWEINWTQTLEEVQQ
jgi:hypothetical protein